MSDDFENFVREGEQAEPGYWGWLVNVAHIMSHLEATSSHVSIPGMIVPAMPVVLDVETATAAVPRAEAQSWSLGNALSSMKGYFSNLDSYAFIHDVKMWESAQFRDDLRNSDEFRELSKQLNELENWAQQISDQGTRRFLTERIATARHHTEQMRTDIGVGPRALFAAGSVLASAYVVATNFRADHNELYQPFVVASYAKSFLQMGMLTFSAHTDPPLMVNHMIERHMLYAVAAGVFGPSTWIKSLAHLSDGLPLVLGAAASALGVTAAVKGGPALVKSLTKLVNGIGALAIAPEQQAGLTEVATRLEQTTSWMKDVRTQYSGEPGKRINDSMNEKYGNLLEYLVELQGDIKEVATGRAREPLQARLISAANQLPSRAADLPPRVLNLIKGLPDDVRTTIAAIPCFGDTVRQRLAAYVEENPAFAYKIQLALAAIGAGASVCFMVGAAGDTIGLADFVPDTIIVGAVLLQGALTKNADKEADKQKALQAYKNWANTTTLSPVTVLPGLLSEQWREGDAGRAVSCVLLVLMADVFLGQGEVPAALTGAVGLLGTTFMLLVSGILNGMSWSAEQARNLVPRETTAHIEEFPV